MWHRVQGLSSWGRWELLQPCKGLWLRFSCFQWVRLKGLQVQAGLILRVMLVDGEEECRVWVTPVFEEQRMCAH